MGRDLLYIDMEAFVNESKSAALLQLAFREALLRQCVIYLDNFDAIFGEDGSTHPILKKLPPLVNQYGWLTFLEGEKPWHVSGVFEDAVFQEIEAAALTRRIKRDAREGRWDNASSGIERIRAQYAGTDAAQDMVKTPAHRAMRFALERRSQS